MKYHHEVSQHRRRRYIRRAFIFFGIILSITIIGWLVIRIDSYLQGRVNTAESTTTDQTSAYFAPSTRIFRTDYFQFQTNKNWSEISSESNESEFIYRAMNKSIIEEELIIYVNNIPQDLASTRLLPVGLINQNQEISPDSVSDHCHNASVDKNIDEMIVTYKKVTLNCGIDNTDFTVLVGQPGGTTRLKLQRPGGATAIYTILYRNVEATPDASELLQILQSFQTR